MVQENYFLKCLLDTVRYDPTHELVAGVRDKLQSVISISDDTLTYSDGLRHGLQSVSCESFIRLVIANLHAFPRLCSLYLEEYDGPLFMEHWPQSLQVVSLVKKHDPTMLNRLYNLRKLGLFQSDLDLTLLTGIAPQLQELAFNSCMDEEQLHHFPKLEWLTYGRHRGNLTPLGSLKHLSHLFIEDLQNPTLDGVQGCEQLANLRIQSNQLLDISALKECTNLEEVTFIPTGEAIRSIEALGGSGLHSLDISYSGVTDFTPLQTMKHLHTLKLNGCFIDDLSVLEGLEHLTVLYLGDIPASATPDFFKPLLKLPRLHSLYVSPMTEHYLPDELKNRSALWFKPVGLSKSVTEVDQDLNRDLGINLTDDEFDALLSQLRM